ncbi:hypothetical protein OUZ56_028207 [Daphnia magna]|uniref:Secreted protein n=1 Tax=Daphnia magna TaxID=35525 RepID=A0ABR0B384_9CRUS|nr:hypothetical protein OUZ56_028207 [Daphnia magna]
MNNNWHLMMKISASYFRSPCRASFAAFHLFLVATSDDEAMAARWISEPFKRNSGCSSRRFDESGASPPSGCVRFWLIIGTKVSSTTTKMRLASNFHTGVAFTRRPIPC